MRIQRNFEYRRGKNNQQYSNKGGRVPTKNSSTDDQSPTAAILSLQNHRTSSSGIFIANNFSIIVALTFVLFTI